MDLGFLWSCMVEEAREPGKKTLSLGGCLLPCHKLMLGLKPGLQATAVTSKNHTPTYPDPIRITISYW